jgi:hypothetical protein
MKEANSTEGLREGFMAAELSPPDSVTPYLKAPSVQLTRPDDQSKLKIDKWRQNCPSQANHMIDVGAYNRIGSSGFP